MRYRPSELDQIPAPRLSIALGATTDLFAMGTAEEVVDEEPIAKTLADPGTVIKRSRGTPADHMACSRGRGPAPCKVRAASQSPDLSLIPRSAAPEPPVYARLMARFSKYPR